MHVCSAAALVWDGINTGSQVQQQDVVQQQLVWMLHFAGLQS
jgi:hypothetical protein